MVLSGKNPLPCSLNYFDPISTVETLAIATPRTPGASIVRTPFLNFGETHCGAKAPMHAATIQPMIIVIILLVVSLMLCDQLLGKYTFETKNRCHGEVNSCKKL